MDIRADKHGDGIWPGNGGVLIPPTGHHNRYIETQDEGQGYEFSVTITVLNNGLKGSERSCIISKVLKKRTRAVEKKICIHICMYFLASANFINTICEVVKSYFQMF